MRRRDEEEGSHENPLAVFGGACLLAWLFCSPAEVAMKRSFGPKFRTSEGSGG